MTYFLLYLNLSNMHQTCVSQVFLQFSTQFIMNKTNAAVSIIVRANPEDLRFYNGHRLELFGIINKTPYSSHSITNWASFFRISLL